MPKNIYEVVAQGARYWFLFLMLAIVWRSWRWYCKDQRLTRKRRRLLPDAGFVGEMVVLEGAGVLERGTALPVPCEGTLGALRTNDLVLPMEGIAKKHLWFRFDNDVGLLTEPFDRNVFAVDGVSSEECREPLYMAHGSCLSIGAVQLRLRLFAGFESTAHAHLPNDALQPESTEPPQTATPIDPMVQQLYLQQQWLMQQYAAQQQAYRQGYEQAMAQFAQENQEDRQDPSEPDDTAFMSGDMADVYSYEAARAQGMVDHSAFMRPEGQRRPLTPEADPEPQSAPPSDRQPVFYPPEMDVEESELSCELYDEDMTDAVAPPKSAYVGHDEAERAKRQVWDRYLGGRQRR